MARKQTEDAEAEEARHQLDATRARDELKRARSQLAAAKRAAAAAEKEKEKALERAREVAVEDARKAEKEKQEAVEKLQREKDAVAEKAAKDIAQAIEAARARSGGGAGSSDGGAAPLDPETCFARHAWIDGALDGFFASARAEATASKESVEEGLARFGKVKWGEYTPGQDMAVISCDRAAGTCSMRVDRVSPPNQPWKSPCIVQGLRNAVETHQRALAELLGGRELKLTIETEDFPITSVRSGARLPSFAMCAAKESIDIPIPDFTYGCYPETRYGNDSSWPRIFALLDHKASALSWSDRATDLFQRSNWGVGPRRSLLPAIVKAVEDRARAATKGNPDDQPSREMLREALGGADLDVEDTKFMASHSDSYRRLEAWCDHKYALHTAGFSYSAALKYRLACGGLVFRVPSRWTEFYEPGLEHAGAAVTLPPYEHEFGDERLKEWVEQALPIIADTIRATKDGKDDPEVALKGRAFVRDELSRDGLDCYWYGALLRYADLYFGSPPFDTNPSTKPGERARQAAQ